MSNTRREFLQSSAALAVGLMGGTANGMGAEPGGVAAQVGTAASIQIPKMKFGSAEISRLVLGVNPMYGFAHYNNNFSKAMADWYTQDNVCAVMHRANSFGINAFNYVNMGRAPQDLARFQGEGGMMHLIIQVTAHDDEAVLARDLKPLALQRRGEEVDAAFQSGTMASEREWCKRARDLGVLVGVGTHKPEVIELVEEQGWDVDFYSGCVYNRTRTEAEWRQVLNGNLLEMPHEIYLQSDPARMYKVMRQTAKPASRLRFWPRGALATMGWRRLFERRLRASSRSTACMLACFPGVRMKWEKMPGLCTGF